MKAAAEPAPVSGIEGSAYDIIDIGDPVEVGKKLPQFEILRMLGRGGMGVVYQACQKQLDRMVAIKILPPVDALSRDFVARFTREARSLAKLNHPNIVSVHDFGESGGLYYIVMEFVDGANLRELFETRKLAPAEALAIVPKICDALEYAHEEGIVHRDIKPENILIDKKGRVKIADFGLAKLLRREALDMSLTLSGTSLGTVRYMAPEQMDKPETVDHRADLYSLGVVIYEMLTGEVPVGRYELPSQKAQVDVRLDEIVLHALEREPARRYQHASEVRDDVQRVTSGPHVGPPPAVAPRAVSVGSEEPHLSMRALLGFIWAALGLMAATFIVLAILDWQRLPQHLRHPINILGLHVSVWAAFAVSSVIGSIVLGTQAIVQIKRSGGKLYGLPLAAADLLFYPLLLLAGLAAFGTAMTWGMLGLDKPNTAHAPVPEILVALAACFLAARIAWRRIAQPQRGLGSSMPSGGITGVPSSPAQPLPVNHLNQFLSFFMTPQPGFARQVGAPMIILTGVWIIVMLVLTFTLPEQNETAHAIALGIGLIGIPLGFLFLTLRWAVRRGKHPASPTDHPPTTAAPKPPRHLLSAILLLLCLGGFFFGVSFQATHSGGPAGHTKHITIGALDPLYVRDSGPMGFSTSLNFVSWSFFALVVAGMALSAVWRVGREDQGKVPRDRAWWRDWWKQAGIWGGLLLVACIVRTALHPDALFPPSRKAGTAAVSSGAPDNAVAYLDGHTSIVKAVAVSADGRTLVSAGLDGRLIVRDLPSGKLRRIPINSSHPAPGATKFRCLSISPDSQHVLVGGDLMAQLFNVELHDGKIDVIPLADDHPASTDMVMYYDNGAKLAYLTIRDTEIVFYDPAEKSVLARAPLAFGGLPSHVARTAPSPDGSSIGIASAALTPAANDPNTMNSTAPYLLRIFDTQGMERLSWEFADFAEYSYAQIIFADPRTFVLALPSGKLQRWTLDAADHWAPADGSVRIKPGRYVAGAVSRDGLTIWLAENRRIEGFDATTGKEVASVELSIGERVGEFADNPIQVLAATNDSDTVAVALWDGRVALAHLERYAPAAATQAAQPVKQPFMIGYAGPALTNEAVQKLKLSKLQSEEIGRILLAYHREYLALQRRHSKVGKDDSGRLLVTIEPFYEECLAVAQRLQTELGGIVDATLLPVIKDGELAFQIFGWGGACNETIAMWKADGNYYVEEKLTSAPGHQRDPYTFNMSGPKLEEIPESFRIYWRE
jgi:predicted Ser/Thr protein kinase